MEQKKNDTQVMAPFFRGAKKTTRSSTPSRKKAKNPAVLPFLENPLVPKGWTTAREKYQEILAQEKGGG